MIVTFLRQFAREASSAIIARARKLLGALWLGGVERHLTPEIAKEFRSEPSKLHTSCALRVLGSSNSMNGVLGSQIAFLDLRTASFSSRVRVAPANGHWDR